MRLLFLFMTYKILEVDMIVLTTKTHAVTEYRHIFDLIRELNIWDKSDTPKIWRDKHIKRYKVTKRSKRQEKAQTKKDKAIHTTRFKYDTDAEIFRPVI